MQSRTFPWLYMRVCVETLSGLAQVCDEKSLLISHPCASCATVPISVCPHLPNHHVLGAGYHSADPVFTVFAHQAVGMQVGIFPICDQLNNNLCRSHIVANLYEKHIVNS